MAVEQIRPVEGQRKAAQRKTQELNVDTAITILFGTSRLEGDSFTCLPLFLSFFSDRRAPSSCVNVWELE
jgi:hypothetical protein